MKAERKFPRVQISHRAQNTVVAGHPWVYETEILSCEGRPDDGDLVDVFSDKDRYLGTAFWNRVSKIRLRLISKNANDLFDEAFWERRLRYAWEYRKTVMGADRKSCRLIFGEADQFPGLTVDRFGPILVAQVLSAGMEKLKGILFPTLLKILREDGEEILGIYERNDMELREREGLLQNKGFYIPDGEMAPPEQPVLFEENGISYEIDFVNGQKTGFFLDQKYNRRAVARLAEGKRVLDCFTHVGSFALNAAKAGAAAVTAVDISQPAVDQARANAVRNGLESRMDFVCGDVFELLPRWIEERQKLDLIILDPPAFTKARQTQDQAMKGYKEINLRAMKLLPRGGYLATASCSHFIHEDLFREMLRSAAHDAAVSLRQIEARQQAPDHPIMWSVPETNYLKFYIFQII